MATFSGVGQALFTCRGCSLSGTSPLLKFFFFRKTTTGPQATSEPGRGNDWEMVLDSKRFGSPGAGRGERAGRRGGNRRASSGTSFCQFLVVNLAHIPRPRGHFIPPATVTLPNLLVSQILKTSFSNTPIGRLRAIGLLEGLSFLLLLGIAMPLKYMAGMPLMVKYVGWAHGLLFVLYLVAVVQVTLVHRWTLLRVAGAVVASLVPFGPFILDGRLRKEEEALQQRKAKQAA